MAIMDALGKAAKKVKDAYKSGDQETSGLGAELAAKAKAVKESGVGDGSPAPAKPATPSAPAKKPAPDPKTQYGTKQGEISPADFNKKYPDLPKMHKGGMVKKTGPHILLKGEAVLSKKDTKKMSALGGQAGNSSVGSPDGMSIDKVADGSFHITHRSNPKDGGAMPEAKKFSARNVKHLVRHVKQAFGGGAQEPDEDEA